MNQVADMKCPGHRNKGARSQTYRPRKTEKGKCEDEGGLATEILRLGGHEMASELAPMYNSVLHRRSDVPPAWKSAKIIIPLKTR